MIKEQLEWNRRQFLTYSATAVAAAAAAGLVGCNAGQAQTPDADGNTGTPTAGTSGANVPLAEQVWDFELEPDIDIDAITEVETADVVVIGAASSGMHCIYSLLEGGASVIALEKLNSDSITVGGLTYRRSIGFNQGFAYNKIAHDQGIKIEFDRLVQDQVRISNHKVDQRKIRRILNLSPKVSAWQLGIMREHGDDVDHLWVEDQAERHQTALPTDATERPGQQDTYWHPIGYTIWAGDVEWALEDMAKQNFGFEITYETTAKKLIQDESGRITGVVALKKDGTLVKYMGSKGVVLASGGYEGNEDMKKKYLPDQDRYIVVVGKRTNTGDGQLMAQWVGAKIEDWPHCPQTWDGMSPEAIQAGYDYIGVAREPWLYVNAYGQRFMNEDVTFAGQGRAISIQPYSMMWTVWDEKYKDWDILTNMKGSICRRMTTVYHDMPGPDGIMPFNTEQCTQDLVDQGVILKADTIEELADLMIARGPDFGIDDMDKQTFLSTVTRYNSICDEGYDWDFGKDPLCLQKLSDPPYYATRTGCGFLVVSSGVYADEHMRVISKDRDRHVIEGLYAIGNMSSGFNALEFSIDTTLGSLAYAATSGWIAAQEILGKPIDDEPRNVEFRNKNIFV
jgi:fumarate reductase flavoprotein subunit